MTRVSQDQMEKLLDLLSEDGVMVHGKVMYTDTNKLTFWKNVSVQLNTIQGGAFKNAYKWCKMWADWKNKTKRKADILFKKKSYEFMAQPQTLTNMEFRLLRIIGYPMNDNNLDSHYDMIHKVEIPDDTENSIHLGFTAEDSNEDDKTLMNFATHKRKNADCEDIIDDKSEVYDLSDAGERTKTHGRRKKKSSPHVDYKMQTKLALEKERSQQKTEELRLRALQLKLKGEELKLKEIEMNKVNYLTSLEEEKLKCFREISSSLKELLERTRNGNLKFNNVI